MSLIQGLQSLFGGEAPQQAGGTQSGMPQQEGNAPDPQQLQQMLSRMNPQQLQQIFSQTAQQMNPQEYSQHITPGAGGTNPLGGIGGAGLSAIASALIQHLGGSAGGGGIGGLLSRIPGLSTTDPNQMDENQVASLARYTQQNHPDIFGKVAAQLGQQQPSLLNSFLGKAGLAVGAAALASHFMKNFQ